MADRDEKLIEEAEKVLRTVGARRAKAYKDIAKSHVSFVTVEGPNDENIILVHSPIGLTVGIAADSWMTYLKLPKDEVVLESLADQVQIPFSIKDWEQIRNLADTVLKVFEKRASLPTSLAPSGDDSDKPN